MDPIKPTHPTYPEDLLEKNFCVSLIHMNTSAEKEGPWDPFYASSGAAGADLCAYIAHDTKLEPGQRSLIPTGIGIAIPPGYEGQIRSRSGLATKSGVVVMNSPGTIDADYRGELKVLLFNGGEKTFTITPGLRIAQLVIAPIVQVVWQKTHHLPATQRGVHGFGSTGTHV